MFRVRGLGFRVQYFSGLSFRVMGVRIFGRRGLGF